MIRQSPIGKTAEITHNFEITEGYITCRTHTAGVKKRAPEGARFDFIIQAGLPRH